MAPTMSSSSLMLPIWASDLGQPASWRRSLAGRRPGRLIAPTSAASDGLEPLGRSPAKAAGLVVERQDFRQMLAQPRVRAPRGTRRPGRAARASSTPLGDRRQQRHLLAEARAARTGAGRAPRGCAGRARSPCGVRSSTIVPKRVNTSSSRNCAYSQPQALGQRLEHRRLGLAADARHALADIDRRLLVLVEQARDRDRSGRR